MIHKHLTSLILAFEDTMEHYVILVPFLKLEDPLALL